MIANKTRLLGTTILLSAAGLTLAACAGNSVNVPRAADVTMAPRMIDPGQSTVISYRVVGGSAADIASAELVGLPPNSMTAGTVAKLAIPATSNTMSSTNVAVRAPAKDGVYPVSLRITTRAGSVSDTPIGTLTVNNVPSRLEAAQINPPSHNVIACAGQPVNVQLTYTVIDPNGANDLREPKVVQVRGASSVAAVVQPMVVQSASAVPVAPGTVIAAPSQTVVASPSGSYTIVNPGVMQQVVVAAPPTPTAIALPPGGVPLSAPARGDSVQETVTTPLTIACPIAAPAQWDWVVQAADDDAPRGQVLSTNQAVAKYFTAQ